VKLVLVYKLPVAPMSTAVVTEIYNLCSRLICKSTTFTKFFSCGNSSQLIYADQFICEYTWFTEITISLYIDTIELVLLQSKTTYIIGFLLHNWQVFLFDFSRPISTVTFCCTWTISISGEWNYLNELKSTGIISHISW